MRGGTLAPDPAATVDAIAELLPLLLPALPNLVIHLIKKWILPAGIGNITSRRASEESFKVESFGRNGRRGLLLLLLVVEEVMRRWSSSTG